MPEPITTALVLAKLGEHILTFLAKRGEDFGADQLSSWLKAPAAQKAAQRTAAQFGQYDALGSQLAEWARRPSVASTLVAYHASSDRRPESLALLKQELEACGFDAAPSARGHVVEVAA